MRKTATSNYLNGKKIAIIGYGSQGHAHALNLKDSGCDVCVGLRAGSKNWTNAEEAGLTVKTVADAAKWADIVMMLINDEVQADVYKRTSTPTWWRAMPWPSPTASTSATSRSVPPAGVDVFMAAPKGPGHTVRSTYVNGKGVPCLVAVEQNATGDAYKIALAYIAGIGGARAGVMETTFHDETETDLFGEQAVLCGGVVDLMRCGFRDPGGGRLRAGERLLRVHPRDEAHHRPDQQGRRGGHELLHLRHRRVRRVCLRPRVSPTRKPRRT